MIARACGASGNDLTGTQRFALVPSMLAGTWTYVGNPGDTISLTPSVSDTVVTGTGFATNVQLRALSNGLVTRVPLVVTGWVSPSRKRLHLDGTSPSIPLLAAQLDATATDAPHIAATWTITVNGGTMWSQTTTVTIGTS